MNHMNLELKRLLSSYFIPLPGTHTSEYDVDYKRFPFKFNV